jgi:hypothetical protein
VSSGDPGGRNTVPFRTIIDLAAGSPKTLLEFLMLLEVLHPVILLAY